MSFMTIQRRPVEVTCGVAKCRGVMTRINLSRLEEGLLHEGFECASCHRRVKYVPILSEERVRR
jgi:hypothetical protein